MRSVVLENGRTLSLLPFLLRLVSPGRTICADSCLSLLETSLQRQRPLPPTQIVIIIVAYSILSRDVSSMPTHWEMVGVNLNCEETPTVHFLTVVTELFFLVSRYFSCCYRRLLWSDVSDVTDRQACWRLVKLVWVNHEHNPLHYTTARSRHQDPLWLTLWPRWYLHSPHTASRLFFFYLKKTILFLVWWWLCVLWKGKWDEGN